jgi:hypothetical protein
MDELPNNEEIKDLYLRAIINEIHVQISKFNESITIPSFVYNIFKDKLEEKGYFVICVIKGDNVMINIPLDNDEDIVDFEHIKDNKDNKDNKDFELIETKDNNDFELIETEPKEDNGIEIKKKSFSKEILDDIIKKNLDITMEIYKYTDFDIFEDYMERLYERCNDYKYVIDNNKFNLTNMWLSESQLSIFKYISYDNMKYLIIDKNTLYSESLITTLLKREDKDNISDLILCAINNKRFIHDINIYDDKFEDCWKYFNYELLKIYIDKSQLKLDCNKSKIIEILLINNEKMDFDKKFEIIKNLLKI